MYLHIFLFLTIDILFSPSASHLLHWLFVIIIIIINLSIIITIIMIIIIIIIIIIVIFTKLMIYAGNYNFLFLWLLLLLFLSRQLFAIFIYKYGHHFSLLAFKLFEFLLWIKRTHGWIRILWQATIHRRGQSLCKTIQIPRKGTRELF